MNPLYIYPPSQLRAFRQAARTCIVFCFGLTMAACGMGPSGEEGRTITFRFIEEEPTAGFSRDRIASYSADQRWRFDGSMPAGAWQLSDGTESRIEDGWLAVRSADIPPKVIWPVELDPRAIQTIEVDLAGELAGMARLFWSDRGEPFSPDKMIKVRTAEVGPDGVYRFDVASHSGWRGHVARLRLDATVRPNVEVKVGEVRAVRAETAPDQITSALGRAWKLDLGDDVRSALMAPPGLVIERELEVPAAGSFRAGYGVQAGARVPVRFRVVLASEAGQRELFTDLLRPGRDAGRWHELELDLSEHAGRRVRLRLSTEVKGEYDLLSGLPAWGSPMVTGVATEQRRPPNVVLISIDTLRADHLSLYGYERETTPHLDRWARENAVTFTRVVAPAPWTLPSHLSMMTGLDPLSHGNNFDDPIPAAHEMLAERMQSAGYETMAFVGGGFMHPRYNWAQGFDRYVYWTGEQDRELERHMDLALEWLDETATPFFLFLHTYEVHSPYYLRLPFYDSLYGGDGGRPEGVYSTGKLAPSAEHGFRLYKRFVVQPTGRGESIPAPAEEIDRIRALYDSGIAFADLQIARLLEALARRGIAENTLVIVTSDHGEALGEHGLAGHSYLYDFNLMVPLVISAPGGLEGGRVVDRQVRLIDLVPTVLDLVGLAIPAGLDGVSLGAAFEGRDPEVPREAWSYAASSNFGISLRAADRLKYTYNDTAWSAVHGEEALYDLESDAGELTDIAAHAAETDRFRKRVLERLDRDADGLRITLRNDGHIPLVGTLSSPLVQQVKVKGRQIPCPCVHLEKGNRAQLEVPPGLSYELYVHALGDETLSLELRREDESTPFFARIDLRQVAERPVTVVQEGAGWRLGSRPGDVGTGMIFEWRDRWGGGEEPVRATGDDLELQEQLRALGYID